MKKIILAVAFAVSLVTGVEAAPNGPVTQADLQAIIQRLNALEAQNRAQAARIAELEGQNKKLAAQQVATDQKVTAAGVRALVPGEGTVTNDTGSIWTVANGQSFYLADKTAGIFQPLTEGGLWFQPYGYLVLEGVWNSDYTTCPMYTDWVNRKSKGHNGHTSTLSVNDSILGFNFFTPEVYNGWKFKGKFEFDLAGDDANHTDFHVRHLWWAMEHEETGWEVLFGQNWHIWKMVSPQEIDGAWMENTGYPYRRSPQIRVTKRWDMDDSSIEARVGIVKNGPGMGGDRDEDGVQDNEQDDWCLFEGALLYDHKAQWEDSDRRWLVGIAGMYGRDKSRRMSFDAGAGFNGDGYWVEHNYSYDGPEDEYDSDLVMFAASVPFFEKFTLTGQVFAGENLGGIQAGIGQTVGFSDPMHKGREVATVGGFVDLRYDITDKWAVAGGYGFDDPTDSEASYAEGRIYNGRAYGDIFYQFNDNLHFGIEYAYLSTDYADYDSATGRRNSDHAATDHRFQFSVYYDF